jgi:hypothetical protein
VVDDRITQHQVSTVVAVNSYWGLAKTAQFYTVKKNRLIFHTVHKT